VVQVTELRSDYLLDWGDSVFATVVATNSKGDSSESQPGNGAQIITKPDQPANLRESTE